MLCKWCECKSCETSNHVFECNIFISEKKMNPRTSHDKYCKIKIFSGTISHGASKEPEAYSEPSQISARKHFCKNS